MEKEELQKLFKKYHEGTCTEKEKSLLEAWYMEFNEHDIDIFPKHIKAIGQQVFRELPGNHTIFLKIGFKLVIAAAIIGLLITVTLTLIYSGKQTNKLVTDLPPGKNKATLTIGSGKQINLTDALNGTIASESGMIITKNRAGHVKITYQPSEHTESSQNILSTPAGGQWQVQLSDGTQIWLNSTSKLTFPASFNKSTNRIVTLEGEAYFEVFKDPIHPFIVISGNQRVEVLGTHFNINSYADEPTVKTTLVEGRVKVCLLGSTESTYLSPGEQSVASGPQISKANVNIDEAMAWTKGSFYFTDQSIQSIMRQLARWYNIDVKYAPNFSDVGLNGRISRNKNLRQVLSALEATRSVHFKMEGRRITVMK